MEWSRISVFDNEGRFVRVWGRGGKTETKRREEWPGQMLQTNDDIAFGLDGTVYVAHEDAADNVMVFQPF